MMGLSVWHILLLGVVVLLLFGGGRFSNMMGDVAKGIKEFKKGMSDEDTPASPPPTRIEGRAASDAPIASESRESDPR